MYVTNYRCFRCGKVYPPQVIEARAIPRCDCGGGLDAEYDYQSIKKIILRDNFHRSNPLHWKYWAFLPVNDLSKVVTMGEGGTPLLENPRLSREIGARLLVKYEAGNPTGSFKDRGSSLEITKALEYNKKKVVLASTGNMGASIAAYAAFAGLECLVFVPSFVGSAKIKQMKAYGAEIRVVEGDYSAAMKLAENYVLVHPDSFLTGDYPWRIEGTKTVGFEILDQLYWHIPDFVMVPIGNGSLAWGIFEAFRDLKEVGFTDSIPSIVGVQVETCSPVVDAWMEDRDNIIPVENPSTIATAIACGDPIDGLGALRAIRESGGMGVKVSDEETLEARDRLGRSGMFVEPSGAVAFAGTKKIQDKIRGKTVVCLATGHGLKDLYRI